jgi:NADH-quinone oxidoreductase subunit N
VFLFSMAGLPPFGGFASKFVLFSSAVDAGTTQNLGWLTWLAVIAVINSAISLYYYLRLLRSMYVDEGEGGRLDVPAGTLAAVFVCLAFVLVAGVWPQPFLDSAFQAAQSLLGLAPVAVAPVP